MKKHTLTLNKTKIVNLSVATQIFGGSGLESDVHNPDATCGIDTTSTGDMTDDKGNSNNGSPTITLCRTSIC